MYQYKTLTNTNIEIVHKAFVEAFSDYQVKIDLPLWKLKGMLKRRGYLPEVSMGAFRDEEIVGFILNGARQWNGKKTVYDTGTGVIPECRKQGITSNMFDQLSEILKGMGFEQYLLEVIQTNTSAYELYKRFGFETIRELLCYQLNKNGFKAVTTWKVEHLNGFSISIWNRLEKFWDAKPSWQNSIDSINAVPDAFEYCIVQDDGVIVGYGLIDIMTGDIPQIAVDKSYRGRGIGSSIITDLIKSAAVDKISVINVDSQLESLQGFLLRKGFTHGFDQYEMLLKF